MARSSPPTSPPPPVPRATLRAAALLSAGVAIAAHLPSIWNDWTNWDDTAYVANNIQLRSTSGLRQIWIPGETPQYYPLTFTTYWLEYRCWGERAAGYHATNVLLHALNAALVVVLLRTYGASPAMALVVALLFATAPFQVMSVAWIAERKNLLSTFFGILSLICLHHSLAAPRRGPYWRWYAAALLCFAAALLSKSAWAAMCVPAFVAAIWLQKVRPVRALLAIIPLVVMSAVAVSITARIEQVYIAGDVYSDVAAMPPLPQRLRLAPAALARYAGMTLAPVSPGPFHPKWPLDWSATGTWLPIAALLATCSILVLFRRRVSALQGWGLTAFVSSLLPVIGLMPFGNLSMTWVSDHFLYYACIGLYAVVATALFARSSSATAPTRPALPAIALVTLVVIAFCIQTYRQIPTWRDAMSLWNRTIAEQPAFYPGYVGRAAAHIGNGDYQAAAADYRTALRLDDAQPQVHNDLAWALMRLGQYDDAETELRAALVLNPRFSRARQNLGVCAERRGDTAAAERAYAEAIELDPFDDLSRANFVTAIIKAGRVDEAERILADGLGKLPRSPRLLSAQTSLLLLKNQLDDAEAACAKWAELDPSNADAHYHLGIIAARRARHEAAIPHYERAIALNGRHAMYWNNLGCALLELRRPAEAATKLQRAVELDANDAPAWNNLGVALDALGQRAASIDAFEHAVHVNPAYVLAQERLSRLLLAEGRHAQAIEHLRQAVRSVQNTTQALASADLLARTLASAPDASIRNPTEALELSDRLLAETEYSVAELFDTQAMALAALGRFEEAIVAVDKAIAAINAQGRTHDVEVITKRRELYQARQPFVSR